MIPQEMWRSFRISISRIKTIAMATVIQLVDGRAQTRGEGHTAMVEMKDRLRNGERLLSVFSFQFPVTKCSLSNVTRVSPACLPPYPSTSCQHGQLRSYAKWVAW